MSHHHGTLFDDSIPLLHGTKRRALKLFCIACLFSLNGFACSINSDDGNVISIPKQEPLPPRTSTSPSGEQASSENSFSEGEAGTGGQVDVSDPKQTSTTGSNETSSTSLTDSESINTDTEVNTSTTDNSGSASTDSETDISSDTQEENTGTESSSGDTTEGDTEESNEDVLETISITAPEVYSNGQRIGYLLEMDETVVLKIWDDQNNRIFRVNEQTGYLIGKQQYDYFADSMCTIAAESISSEGSECYHGSQQAARQVFIEGGNRWGTILGHHAKTYSVFSDFLPYYTRGPPPDSTCSPSAKPPNTFSLCLRTIEDIEDVPLSLPLPIEIRAPANSSPRSDDSTNSTLNVYSAGEYIGDFVGLNEIVITVYHPSMNRIFGVNKHTGNIVGGGDLHAFSDDQCTQNLTRIPWSVKTHQCTLTTQGETPHRIELWAHKGDIEGWELGQYLLESSGPYLFMDTIYWTPWFLIRCLPGKPQCVRRAISRSEDPLRLPLPIEIRAAGNW